MNGKSWVCILKKRLREVKISCEQKHNGKYESQYTTDKNKRGLEVNNKPSLWKRGKK